MCQREEDEVRKRLLSWQNGQSPSSPHGASPESPGWKPWEQCPAEIHKAQRAVTPSQQMRTRHHVSIAGQRTHSFC